ncbi:hypothetical protein P5673_019544 [Acropora cervicornis]|uniref:Uncharacterized protein n=1 Tax=Acropora cervicornis TaxID=6130 RepID=A0AAD9QB53_ACRCE|nr:hypothetical protein P5673_019544 [Acropora cervicornis]
MLHLELKQKNSSLLDRFNCKRDANLSDDQRCKCRYNLIVVDNTHRFACFIRGPTVIALYKHRGHLKITVIVSAVLHSLTRYTLLITANAFQIISISFGENSFVHLTSVRESGATRNAASKNCGTNLSHVGQRQRSSVKV